MIQFIKENPEIFKLIITIVFAVTLIFLVYFAIRYESKNTTNSEKIKKMTTLSILASISVVLYYFLKIPMNVILPFMPGFLDIQFSSVPIFIGGYMFGPISGVIITVIRMLAKLPGSTTAGVGEIADLLIGFVTVLIAAMIYHHKKTKKTAIISLLSIVASWTITALIINWLFILSFYMRMYGFDAVFGMLTTIPGITRENYMLYYLLFAILPFNIILSSLVSLVTFVLYKRLSHLYTDIHFCPKKSKKNAQ